MSVVAGMEFDAARGMLRRPVALLPTVIERGVSRAQPAEQLQVESGDGMPLAHTVAAVGSSVAQATRVTQAFSRPRRAACTTLPTATAIALPLPQQINAQAVAAQQHTCVVFRMQLE